MVHDSTRSDPLYCSRRRVFFSMQDIGESDMEAILDIYRPTEEESTISFWA